MRIFIVNFITFALISLLSLNTQAQLGYQNFPHIHINGMHLNETQIINLNQNLGYEIPNGFYWVNDDTGEWGYEGNSEVLGTIYTEANSQSDTEAHSKQTNQQGDGAGRPYISNDTGTGSAVIDPNGCSYVSAGGMTVKSCD